MIGFEEPQDNNKPAPAAWHGPMAPAGLVAVTGPAVRPRRDLVG
jgi:hypothetical protein